jgi:sugar phosphate permease
MPTLTRYAFGARDFASIWSILTTASSIGSLIATPAFGMVYDASGSYAPAMIASTVMLVVSLIAMFLCFHKE